MNIPLQTYVSLPHTDQQSRIRTLRLKVKRESYPWLNQAAIEVNQVWNYCNETSHKATETGTERPKSKCLRQLVVREWRCVYCGAVHDRDVNAARNILTLGSRCRTSVSGNELPLRAA